MKKIIIFGMIMMFGTGATALSQTIFDSIRIEQHIAIRRSDAAQWIKRYQADIDRYRQINDTMRNKQCDVLFLGSSSINLWNTIDEDLSPLTIIRRAYGGSTIRDNIYNYNDIAHGFQPRSIAIYIENDFGPWKEAINPGETYDLFRVFIDMLRIDYPKIPIFIISFKPSFSKNEHLPEQLIINRLLKDYAENGKNIIFIDITKGMYDGNGMLRSDIFEDDKLHINQKGYQIWTSIIKPVILNRLKIHQK